MMDLEGITPGNHWNMRFEIETRQKVPDELWDLVPHQRHTMCDSGSYIIPESKCTEIPARYLEARKLFKVM